MKKKLITILMIVSILPIILVSAFYYHVFQKNLMEICNEIGLTQVQRTQSNVNEFMEKHLMALRSMADNPSLKNRDLVAAKPLLVAGVKLFPEMSMVMDDLNGNQILRGDNEKMGFVGTREFYKSAVAGTEAISEPLVSSTNGKIGINFAVPIKDNNSKIIGVIQSLVALDKISEFVKKESSTNTTVFITDGKGVVLAHPKGNLTDKEKDLTNVLFVKNALAGETGSAEYNNEQGQKMLVYYTADKLTGWAICAETPYDVVMSKVYGIRTTFVVVLIVTLILVLLIGYFAAGLLIKPIIKIRDRAVRVAAGDLRIEQLAINSQDEMGELARSFNEMTEHLRRLVKQVQTESHHLVGASEELTAGSEQSALASNQVATSITKIACGNLEQLRAVGEVSTAVGNMAATLQQITATANEVAIAADHAVAITKSGQVSVDHAVVQIGNVDKGTKEVGHAITDLEESSRKIGEIVTLISSIAGQTNLLALNAAIEAARAGEQGRGFAVVADEVRKLAEQSHNAAQEIASLIKDNTADIGKAVWAMEQGSKDVEQGMILVSHAGNDFKNIYQAIQQLSAQVREISIAIEDMAIGSQQIVTAVGKIETVSKIGASETESASAVTQEQSASIEEIASSSQELARLAENLQQTINKFQI